MSASSTKTTAWSFFTAETCKFVFAIEGDTSDHEEVFCHYREKIPHLFQSPVKVRLKALLLKINFIKGPTLIDFLPTRHFSSQVNSQ